MKVYDAKTMQELSEYNKRDSELTKLFNKHSTVLGKELTWRLTAPQVGDHVLIWAYGASKPYDVYVEEVTQDGLRGSYQIPSYPRVDGGFFSRDKITKIKPVKDEVICCDAYDCDAQGKVNLKEDFVWYTAKGNSVFVSQMETNHLFNAFRMLFNHGVPAAFRVGQFNRRHDVYEWDNKYKEQAFDALLAELKKRIDELSWEQKDELQDMADNSQVFKSLQYKMAFGAFVLD